MAHNQSEVEAVEEIESALGEEDTAREGDIQSTVTALLREAIDHYDEHLGPDQIEATDRYYGRPYGDEEKDRSKVVSTDTRDVTRSQMPSLMRIFFNREHVVEFRPRAVGSIEDYKVKEAIAREQTAHIDRVVTELNPGFSIFHSAFKDAGVRRIGYIKWWWEDKETVTAEEHENLTISDLILIGQDDSIEMELTGTDEDEEGNETFSAILRYTDNQGYERIAAIPPEEIVWTPNARSRDEAEVFAHVREVPEDELVDMGIDPDMIEDKRGGSLRRDAGNTESLSSARQFHNNDSSVIRNEEAPDEARTPITFAEAYVRVGVGDEEDEGPQPTELRMFQCLGADFEIVNGDGEGEVVDEIPFALFTPDPEPHAIVGLGNWDLVKQTERIKTQVERATLDSLAQAVDSDTVVLQGEVNMRDVMKKELSKVIRVRKMGSIEHLSHRFVGDATLPVLDYYDKKREDNTGMSKASRGLDAGALQSTDKQAVARTFDKNQEYIELMAMVYAETGMRDLYTGLLRLSVKHRQGPVIVTVDGQQVSTDPRSWDAEMDLVVNLALGQGTPEERIATHAGILEKQEGYLAQGVPFVDFTHVRSSLDDIARLANLPAEKYFGAWGPQQQAQFQEQQSQQEPPPDPTMALVQVEQMKAQSEVLIGQEKLKLEEMKIRLQDDREREKIARNAALEERRIEAKHKVEIHDAELRAAVAGDRAAMDAQLQTQAAAGGEQ